MRERWIVRLLVDRDPDADEAPNLWDWTVEDADVAVLSSEIVGIVAPADQPTWEQPV